MKKFILLTALALLSISTATALEPIKVAIFKTGGAANVQVNLTNYTGGTATNVFTSTTQSLTPNGSGIIMVDISDATYASGTTWSAITPASVNSYYVIDVNVGGNLYAQYRLDQQIIDQSQGGVFDNNGNFTPAVNGDGTLGSDNLRWDGLYVTGNTIHVGPVDGELNNDELAFSYNDATNTGTIKIDNVSVIDATKDLITINSLVSQEIGNDNTAFGKNALVGNTSNGVTGTGLNAAYQNTGSQVTANGNRAAYQNTGSYVIANGSYSAENNTGDKVTASGGFSAKNNSGDNVVAIGYQSGEGNTGNNVIALGQSAAFGNTGGNVAAFGTNVGDGNSMSNVTIFSNSVLPEYADRPTAVAAITVGNGAVAGNTYMYYNTATNSIEAVRLP